MKSILNVLDILLGHIAAGIMTFLLYLSLGVVAIFSLVSIPIDFFEYGAGISELDLAEIGLISCLCIVIWRFYRRGNQLNWTKWQMLRRFVFTVSSMALLLSSLALIGIWDEVSNKGRLELEFFTTVDKFDTYIFSILVILVIYAAAPLPKLWQKEKTEDKSTDTPIKQPDSVLQTSSTLEPDSQTTSNKQPESVSTLTPQTEQQADSISNFAQGKL
ncbi:hypothetical protein [Shewanella goraebulensis]|uniref:hypothetical protein n=1 Tax=Shewanella goraebulensis TaxID=3050637 RepID=UPI00254FBCCC|nr:hypothetical protein [Shewanella goraebulensis]